MAGYGAVGAISVTANVLPAAMAEFCQAFGDGDDDKACALDAKLQPIHEALFMETSPIPTKWALNAMGRIDVGIRLPRGTDGTCYADDWRLWAYFNAAMLKFWRRFSLLTILRVRKIAQLCNWTDEMTQDIRICFIGDSLVNGTGDEAALGWAGRLCACAMANAK